MCTLVILYGVVSARESYNITCQLSMQNMYGIDVLLIIIILRIVWCVVHFFGLMSNISMFLSENCWLVAGRLQLSIIDGQTRRHHQS